MTNSWFGRNALDPNSLVAQDIAICIASSVNDMACHRNFGTAGNLVLRTKFPRVFGPAEPYFQI